MTAPPEATRGSGQEEKWEFKVEAGHVRLDQFLVLQSTELTRAQLHRLIVEGQVLLNGRSAKPAQKVRSGDLVSLTIPPPRETGVLPQWMPLTVIYQDSDIVVIDKPAGLSVHPGPGHPDQTLVNGLLARCPDIQGVGGAIRPGIVHRLDKDTSGLMMVAKNHHSHQELSDQIKNRQVNKGYLALATGTVTPDAELVDQPIARDPRHRKRMAVVPEGRESRTRYKVLETPPGHNLLELILETGRTHQIRVHLAYLGHPLLGDGVYGRSSPRLDRHFLHAYKLGFQHPRTGEPLEFQSELPENLAAVLEELKSSKAPLS